MYNKNVGPILEGLRRKSINESASSIIAEKRRHRYLVNKESTHHYNITDWDLFCLSMGKYEPEILQQVDKSLVDLDRKVEYSDGGVLAQIEVIQGKFKLSLFSDNNDLGTFEKFEGALNALMDYLDGQSGSKNEYKVISSKIKRGFKY